ncbi:hypothetical protein G7Y89_g9474 [Cudoniella acicularis]|uniref:Uncharacterized protein n=1 Tax=Cudoniella acicularis TaxID=354080 RepID=A0A8H4VZL4_9HELO|nr:hypothetical protein G7Y89_g9474 [Cudoniella acicularis]
MSYGNAESADICLRRFINIDSASKLCSPKAILQANKTSICYRIAPNIHHRRQYPFFEAIIIQRQEAYPSALALLEPSFDTALLQSASEKTSISTISMPRQNAVATDTTSITAMNGSGYAPHPPSQENNDLQILNRYEGEYKIVDPKETSQLRTQRLSSFQTSRPPFHIRDESVLSSEKSMARQMGDWDALFAAAGQAKS